jgi:hypothetical protein
MCDVRNTEYKLMNALRVTAVNLFAQHMCLLSENSAFHTLVLFWILAYGQVNFTGLY